jgi:hypothetical protein
MSVEFYQQTNKAEWDEFVLSSKNGTFLFRRDYMEYHSDRFSDYSLIVRSDNQIVALMPANIENDTVFSHQGLSYGGMVTSFAMTTPEFISIFDDLLDFLSQQGVSKIDYKTVPGIYHKVPAEEDRYALFLHKARLVRRDVLSVICAGIAVPQQKRRVRGANRARKEGLEIREGDHWSEFWPVLEARLRSSHQVAPVHALDEITHLKDLFPDDIRLFVASRADEVLAGCVIFHTGTVAHAQYIAASPEGQSMGALDLLFHQLINDIFRDTQYFDFGISNEEMGKVLNDGLIKFKEGFGARAIVHDHYELDLSGRSK